ncbi:MAG: hypothetical protein AABW48_03965 [Nanoarchaeota archaeon]
MNRKTKYGLLLSALLSGCASQSGVAKNSPLFPFLQTKYYNHYEQEIQIVFDSQKTDNAVASAVTGFPIIYFNPEWIGKLSPEKQIFVFYHEIGHFRFDHIYKVLTDAQYIQAQKEADCYSGKVLRDKLHYNPQQMASIYELVGPLNGNNSERQTSLKNCLENRF